MLSMEPVLQAPDFYKLFSLAVDLVMLESGKFCYKKTSNVSYYLKKFNVHQKAYYKEKDALIDSLKQFEVYIWEAATSTNVYMVHNPLVFIHSIKNKNWRLLVWSLHLQKFSLEIKHILGKSNPTADALSRAWVLLYFEEFDKPLS